MEKSNIAHLEEVEAVDRNVDALRGAAIIEEERKLGLVASARLHWKILLICLCHLPYQTMTSAYHPTGLSSFTAGMLFGYDIVVNGASISMPAFLIYFGDIGPTGPYLPPIWTSLWTAMTSLAQVVGGFVVGQVTDRYGRKCPTGLAVRYLSMNPLGGIILEYLGLR
jgi:hypothetical protein